jgi:lipoprotein signal peptidase
MPVRHVRAHGWFWLGLVTIFFLDQVSKWWASSAGMSVVMNSGVSFGWLAGMEGIWLTIGLVGLIFWLQFGLWSQWRSTPVLAGMFFGGAWSNLLDRLFYNGVRDWMSIPVIGVRNNLADWAIVGSAILMLGMTYVRKKNTDSV